MSFIKNGDPNPLRVLPIKDDEENKKTAEKLEDLKKSVSGATKDKNDVQ